MTTHTEPRLIPAKEAARRFGRHPITFRSDLRSGRVPGVRIGGRWFVSSVVIDQLTSGNSVAEVSPMNADASKTLGLPGDTE